MPITVTMPRLSDTMQEGTLNAWRVKVGDAIKAGDILADVETDKATMELQAFDDGTVAHLAVAEGQTVPVGALILVLAVKGESIAQAAKAAESFTPETVAGSKAEQAAATGAENAGNAAASATTTAVPAERPRVSPLARKIAQQQGVDLTGLAGTGPGGRIIKRDVLAAAEATSASGSAKPATPSPSAPPVIPTAVSLTARTIPLSNIRKTIARRLVESKSTIPHFTVTITVAMDALLSLRTTLNKQLENQGVKLSVNDFLIRAAALACVQHPVVNSSWSDAGIVQHGTVNVGVAVNLPAEKGGGLVVPVLRDVQHKGLRAISQEIKALADKARGKGLTVEDMSDGTFTLSNLGMYGVDHFEAIINPPQSAILAVGAATQKPVVRDGQIVPGYEMTCTLSADHRVIDGAAAAEYLATLRQMLENPAVLLV